MKFSDFINKSLHRKMLLRYFLVMLISIILLSSISYVKYVDTINKKSLEYDYELLELLSKDLRQWLNQINQLMFSVVYSSDISNIISQTGIDSAQRIRNQITFNRIVETQLNFFYLKDSVDGFMIIDKSNKPYYSGIGVIDKSYRFEDQDWFRKTIDGEITQMYYGVHERPYIHGKSLGQKKASKLLSNKYISCVRKIQVTDQKKGVVAVIDFNISKIKDIFLPLKKNNNSNVYIINDSGTVIYNDDTEMIGRNIESSVLKEIVGSKNGSIRYNSGSRKLRYTYNYLDIAGWYIVCENNPGVPDAIKGLRNFTLILFAVVVLIMIILFELFSKNLIRPVNTLRRTMKKVEKGDLNASVYTESKDEIGELSTGFNKMVGKIRVLIDEIYETKLREKEAQLNALQAQINPHFLYNTLETISCIAQIEELDSVSDIALALSSMFRYSIMEGKETVTVNDEIEHVKNFLYIISIRYEDKINVDMEIPESIKCSKTLRLILQPLVENAVYHGLEVKKGKGRLKISAKYDDTKVAVFVEDNGVGFSQNKLLELKKYLNNSEDKKIIKTGDYTGRNYSRKSIGMKNVHDRIRLYYGNEYGLSIDSVAGKGTIVKVTFPLII